MVIGKFGFNLKKWTTQQVFSWFFVILFAASLSIAGLSGVVMAQDANQPTIKEIMTADLIQQWSQKCNKLDFYSAITSKDYADEKFPYQDNSGNLTVSDSADKDGNVNCTEATATIAIAVYGSKKEAIDALYDTTKVIHLSTGGDSYVAKRCNVNGEVLECNNDQHREIFSDFAAVAKKWADSKITGDNKAYVTVYLKQTTQEAFKKCWTYNPTKDSANHPKADATTKYDKAYYNKTAGSTGSTNVGYLVEQYIEKSFDDGRANCDKVFEKVKAEKLLDYTASDDLSDLADQKKYDEIIKLFDADSKGLIYCVAATNTPGLSGLSLPTLKELLAQWLSSGSTETLTYQTVGGTSATLDADKSAALQKCLLDDGAYGADLQKALDIDPTSFNPTSGTDDKPLIDCADLSLGWNPKNWIPNSLDWFGCSIAKAALGVLNKASSWIAVNLETTATTSGVACTTDPKNANDVKQGTKECVADSGSQSQADQALQKVWNNVLKIANILFVIAFLIMIISTALNLGFVDAYTIKKYLPKIIIAVIAANLSWFIVQQAIGITNVLGTSVREIILSPLKDVAQSGNVSVGSSFSAGVGASLAGIIGAGAGVAIGAVVAGGWIVFLPAVLALLFAALTAIVVIMIRKVIVFALIVFAPIAITMWAIPGMENWAKRWWKLLIEMLMVYPFIMAMFALGEFAAILTLMANSSQSSNPVPGLMAIAFLCIPLFMLPTVFKLASSTLANITGMVNDKGKGLIDRSKKARGKAIGDGWEKIKGGTRFKQPNGNDSLRGRLNRGLQTASIVGTGKAGWRPSKIGATAGMARTRQNLRSMKDFMENDETIKLFNKDDDKLHALVHGEDEQHVRSILENSAPDRFAGANNRLALDQAVAEVMEAKKKGGQSARIAAVMAQAATGTAYDTAGEMLDDINAVAGGDRTMAGLMLADMKGAAMQSGRVDLGGAGFAHLQGVMERRRASMAGGPAFSTDDATADVLRNVIASQGGREASYGKRQSAVQVAQAHHQYIQDTIASATNGTVMEIDGVQRAATERDVKQALAAAANAHDAISAASPQNGRAFADNLFGQGIALTPAMQNSVVALPPGVAGPLQAPPAAVSVKTAMDLLSGRGDGEYAEMRRDYGTAGDAQAAAQAQGGLPPGPAAPPGGPPGGLPPTPSDYRLKRDIVFIGKSPSGINIYKFRYLWSDTEYVGVIAQEIEQILPAAVWYTSTGYMSVDYSMLDVKMQKFDEWEDPVKYAYAIRESIHKY